jgi:spore maturation protein CgeB
VRIVFLGLSITSSWGNGHATNYRALVRELAGRGHQVIFAERDVPWYAAHRDLPHPPWGQTRLYGSVPQLRKELAADVRAADLVVVGSYVPEGAQVGEWVLATARGTRAFYDIDTPITMEALERGGADYLTPAQIPRYDLYLSFTGGPTLDRLRERFGALRPRAFYCLVDLDAYAPAGGPGRWDLGYLGTYSPDRQGPLRELLMAPAQQARSQRFVVAGPQYPAEIDWSDNVQRIEHVAPGEHPGFYSAQRFTLNLTRERMRRAGWSPSVRLFEAAACGVPVISDRWPGLSELFAPGEEILLADRAEDVLRYLNELPEADRRSIAARARKRVLARHGARQRVDQLEAEVDEVRAAPRRRAA